MTETRASPPLPIANEPEPPVGEPALNARAPVPLWRRWLLRSALTIGAFGLLAVPDWIDWRQSRFAWEDFRGTYVLGGAFAMLIILIVGRLLAIMFDARSGERGDVRPSNVSGQARGHSRGRTP